MTVKSRVARSLYKGLDLGATHLLPIGLPLLLLLILGPLLAALIVILEAWYFALAAALLIPLAILLLRYPFAAILIWLLLMPWFPFKGTYRYIYFTIHRFLIPLTLLYVVISRGFRQKKYAPVRLGMTDLAMVVFGALGAASIFLTNNHWKTIFTLQDQFLIPFTAYWLVRFTNAGERELRRLIPWMLVLSLAESAIGLLSWFAPQTLPSIWRTTMVGERATGTIRQPAVYACILIVFFVFFYHDAMNRKNGLVRTVEILAFGLGMVCIFFTFTRGAWLVGLLVLLALLYLYPKTTALLILIIVPIMLLLSTSLLAREFTHAYNRLITTDEGAEARLVLANAGKKMFYARPVFGWGFSNYDRYDTKFLERVGETSPTVWQIRKGTSHHTYLTILAEMGVVGFFFYALPVLLWLFRSIQALPKLPQEGFWSRRLLIAMWLPIGAHVILAQDLDMRFFFYCLTLFWINLGFIGNMVDETLKSTGVSTRSIVGTDSIEGG